MGAGGLLLWLQSVVICDKKGTASDHFTQNQLNITQILFSDIFVFLRNPGGGLELE